MNKPPAPWRVKIHTIIYEADTPLGKYFDLVLLATIVLSVGVVMLESVAPFKEKHSILLRNTEWFFTGLFTLEYILRVISIEKARHYIFSFFGIVDLLAILPTYLDFVLEGTHYLIIVRILRLLRIFRVLKLARYLGEARTLTRALKASRHKITVFLITVVTLIFVVGGMMYLVEGGTNGFDSIPHSVYWAVVTITTVGYGDIVPHTPLGKFLSMILMIMGYAIIAVPTGIVSVEMQNAQRTGGGVSTQSCFSCGREGHDVEAVFCKFCGGKINPQI